MQLSKEDMFCENLKIGTSASHTADNVLDFHSHGDDILGQLFWSAIVTGIDPEAATADEDVTVAWETSDTENFSSPVTLASVTVDSANVAKGAWLVRNAPLPKGLKRYNRLAISEASGTKMAVVTAFVHDGRDEGTPFLGL